MANMKTVNKGIKESFGCDLGIKAIRGDGYVYFYVKNPLLCGFDKVESIMTHPVNTTTEDVTRMCVENIKDYMLILVDEICGKSL
jgi:hypothetical protein